MVKWHVQNTTEQARRKFDKIHLSGKCVYQDLANGRIQFALTRNSAVNSVSNETVCASSHEPLVIKTEKAELRDEAIALTIC